jgi:polyhydroxyalkanoate synthase
MQLIQYSPATAEVLKRPAADHPAVDQQVLHPRPEPEKSFIKWCVDQGLTVFVISWVNPDARQATKGFAEYMREGPLEALDVIKEVTGEDRVHAIGYCVGGTLMAVTLAWMAAKGDKRIASATFFAAQVDFTYAGRPDGVRRRGPAQDHRAQHGRARLPRRQEDGDRLQHAALERPDLALRDQQLSEGQAALPVRPALLEFGFDRMPAANHSFYLRNCYLENKLSKGQMVIDNVQLDLGKITIRSTTSRRARITSRRRSPAFLGSKFFGGPVKYVLAGSVTSPAWSNPPAKPKYQYWTGDAPVGNLERWLTTATEHAGSWWPDWVEWIKAQKGETVPAREPGGGLLTADRGCAGKLREGAGLGRR